MNLAQIRCAARDALTAGKGPDTVIQTDLFWSDAILNYYIQKVYRTIQMTVKRARADFFTAVLKSTDPVTSMMGWNYNPASLKITAGVGSYQLPPNFLRMKVMTDLRLDQKARFRFSDLSKEEFRIIYSDEQRHSVGSFLCDIIALKTLIIRPIPDDSFDIEIIYEKNVEVLSDYFTGSITISANATTGTMAGADMAKFSAGDEVIVSSTPASPSLIEPAAFYPVVKSTAGNEVTFEGPYTGVSVTGAVYTLSKVPDLPHLYHDLLVIGSVIEGLRKGTNPYLEAIDVWQSQWDRMTSDLVGDAEIRQGSDIETAEAYLEDEN